MWPNRRIFDLFNIQLPIIQAPMAGSNLSEMVVAVSEYYPCLRSSPMTQE
jgi:nitronate monooxygenase